MAPRLSYGRHQGPPSPTARPAAVLVALWQSEDQWHIPMTVRQPHLASHSGQISLPGGAIEKNESPGQAALREAHEELGIAPQDVQLVGALPPLYLYNSDYLVTPLVARLRREPLWHPCRHEVAELFHLPLPWLGEQPIRPPHKTVMRRGHNEFSVPCFRYQGRVIWGATAMILAELVFGPFDD